MNGQIAKQHTLDPAVANHAYRSGCTPDQQKEKHFVRWTLDSWISTIITDHFVRWTIWTITLSLLVSPQTRAMLD